MRKHTNPDDYIGHEKRNINVVTIGVFTVVLIALISIFFSAVVLILFWKTVDRYHHHSAQQNQTIINGQAETNKVLNQHSTTLDVIKMLPGADAVIFVEVYYLNRTNYLICQKLNISAACGTPPNLSLPKTPTTTTTQPTGGTKHHG